MKHALLLLSLLLSSCAHEQPIDRTHHVFLQQVENGKCCTEKR
jgi:hypothetical protein